MTGKNRLAGLKRLLHPRHIAVIGGRFAEAVIRQSERIGFAGEIWPVNPRRATLGAHRCFPDIEALPAAPDAAFIAVPREASIATVKALLETGLPLFGICLGHQILSLALGAKTEKMHLGHRGANHPVKDLTTGKVEITSQNHGFVVSDASLPDGIEATHVSLFDGSNEGLAMKDRPVFSVQYHPEASPGPTDSHYLFQRFVDLIDGARAG